MELFCTEHSKPLEPIFEFHMGKIHYYCPVCEKCLASRSLTPEEIEVGRDFLHIGSKNRAHKLEKLKGAVASADSERVGVKPASPALNKHGKGPEVVPPDDEDLDRLVNCEPAINALRMLLLKKGYMDDYEACDPKIWSDGDVLVILFQNAVDDYGFEYEKFLKDAAK